MASSEPKWLIVRNLPSCFTLEDKMDLLRYFGAAFVKVSEMDKAIAFGKFVSHEECSYALLKLHQQEVLGERLVVEFSDVEPSDAGVNKKQEPEEDTIPQQLRDLRDLVNAVQVKDQFVRVSLKAKYAYPSPTPEIIHNISNALITVPKFYTQVLHLMNKMNLPPPFGAASEQSQVIRAYYAQRPQPVTPTNEVETGRQESEEEESELESEGETPHQQLFVPKPLKRRAPQDKVKKKARLIDMMKPVTTQKKEVKETVPVQAVFEPSAIKSIQIHVKKTIDEEKPINTKENPITSEVGGFGKIEPVSKPPTTDECQNVEDDETIPTVISLQELKENQLPSAEWAKISAFKNYSEGEVSERLYIKNLAKKVEEKELRHIYGRYVDWSNQVHVNIFDVRVMQEGRMKGQAFVNLPTVERALNALRETNGYLLKGKPMVVQFARSAKPKTE